MGFTNGIHSDGERFYYFSPEFDIQGCPPETPKDQNFNAFLKLDLNPQFSSVK